MIRSEEHFILIELKNKAKNWLEDAIEQLESTLNLYLEQFDLKGYKYKRLYACNKRHPHFEILEHERKKYFHHKYSVRIHVEATIIIP